MLVLAKTETREHASQCDQTNDAVAVRLHRIGLRHQLALLSCLGHQFGIRLRRLLFEGLCNALGSDRDSSDSYECCDA